MRISTASWRDNVGALVAINAVFGLAVGCHIEDGIVGEARTDAEGIDGT